MSSKNGLNGEVLNLLKQVGLNQYESRIYTSLVSGGSSTARELAETSNVPRSRVYDVLTALEKKGFAIVQLGRPVKYIAVPVDNAITQVRAAYEDEYNKKLNFVGKLEKDLRDALSEHLSKKKIPVEAEDIVGVLKGKNNIYAHLKHLIANSEDRIIKVTNEHGLANLEKHCKGAFEKAKKKGVDFKILANIPGLKATGKLSDYADIRAHKSIGGRFLVKDGQDVVLLTHPEESALWIKSDYLAGTLEKLFEHAWEKGKPLSE